MFVACCMCSLQKSFTIDDSFGICFFPWLYSNMCTCLLIWWGCMGLGHNPYIMFNTVASRVSVSTYELMHLSKVTSMIQKPWGICIHSKSQWSPGYQISMFNDVTSNNRRGCHWDMEFFLIWDPSVRPIMPYLFCMHHQLCNLWV